MSDFTGYCVAVGIGVAVMGIAYGARAGMRRQVGDPLRGPPKLISLLTFFIPSAAVLLLTLLVWAASGLNADFSGWLNAHAPQVRAWVVFWCLMFAIDGVESALRFLFALRGRPFPLPTLIRNILHFLLVVGAILLVAKMVLDHDISTALASTALLTAVIGFALQGVLGNLLAGMSLHIVRSTVPGDWVAIGDIEGEVLETNWRETRLRTIGGHVLIVPNSKVAESVIHNMTHPTPLRRVSVSVGASYFASPVSVIEALEAAALSVPEVARAPKPGAVLTEYKDFCVNYDLRFWTDRYYERAKLISDVQSRVWYQFKRRGIEIPFPVGDQLLNDMLEVAHRRRHRPSDEKEVEQNVEDLKRSDFCRTLLVGAEGQPLLADDELRPVARAVRRVQYMRGETLFAQGDSGDSAYVLVSGSVGGRVEFRADVAPHTFALKAGALLGEMSLITGLPRTATLQVTEEAELLEIPKAAFVQLLGLRADIPAKLAELAARRAAQNAAMYEKLKAMPVAELGDSLRHESILQRFRRLLQR